jgi:hypothetical protein
MSIGRELGVQTGAAKKVEGEESLWQKAVPEVEREIFVGAAEAGDEVVFERADCAFGGIAAVDVGRDELKIDVLRTEEVFQDAGAFVVEAL